MSLCQEATEQEEQAESNENNESSTMTRATSFVSESIKSVGVTVSRLSKSFSMEKTSLNEIDAENEDTIPLSDLEPVEQKPAEQKSVAKVVNNSSINLSHRRSQSVTSFSSKSAAKIESPSNMAGNFESGKSQDAFNQEVWTWGRGWRGQQGHGDMLDRLQPCTITELLGTGVIKVSCGSFHSLAMTISGLVFGWGDNGHGQACPSYNLAVCSLPKLISLPVGETAYDIGACDKMSIVLTDASNVYVFGKVQDEEFKTLRKMDLKLEAETSIRKMFVSNGAFFGSVVQDSLLPLQNFKALEKLFLNKLKEILKKVIEPLCNEAAKEDHQRNDVELAKKTFATNCQSLMNLVRQSVKSSWDFNHLIDVGSLMIVKHTDQYSKAFFNYTKSLTDCLVCEGFKVEHESKMASTVMDLLNTICHVQNDSPQESLQLLLLGNRKRIF